MNSTGDFFSKTISDYDTLSNKVVMKNDCLHNELVNAISLDSNSNIAICDLGCGTGHGLKIALQKFKNCRAVGIDSSGKMIEKCEKNLQKFKNKMLLCADFTNVSFPKEEYDAVISAVAIHNILHTQKEKLFQDVFNSLKKGGVFTNGDFIEGETEEINTHYRKLYRTYLEKNLSREELKAWMKHAFNDDKPMKLSEQFEILKNCGFHKVDKIWQFENEVVYRAIKHC
ncbi:MAG: class I SAM-dependent methyltransferase [Candidatus Micrarchaeia archaeon]|jgi:tRNA (cmo5U34)-methyltransferase